MSRYGDSDYDDMFYELDKFLKSHKPSELLTLVQEAVEWWEEMMKRKNRSLDEWCTDCKEYDHEKRCCPRWNKVIKETVNEIKSEAYKHGHSKGVKKGIEIGLRKSITALKQPEIITCKECIHRPEFSEDYDPDAGDSGMNIIFPDFRCPCQCEDPWYNRMPDDDWFCGNGERRKEENDDGE